MCVCFGGSRPGVPSMDSQGPPPEMSNFYCLPVRAGGTPIALGAASSADGLNRPRRTVVVVPLSTDPFPRSPLVVAVPPAGDRSVAVCDQIRVVDRIRLRRLAG